MGRHYSIVLPVRNGGEMVKRCVRSVLDQDHTDFDFLILDNSSTDGTAAWIASLNDNRIKIFPSGQSLSMAENWGRIAGLQKREYFTMIGHDDLLDKNYLSGMDKLISAQPGLDLYQAHFRFINATGALVRKCSPMQSYYGPGDFLKAILGHKLDTMGTGYLIRSAKYDSLGGIPLYPNLLFADHALWISMAAEKGIAVTGEELFSFRVHQSVSTTTQVPAYIRAFYLFLDFLKELRQNNDVFRTVLDQEAAGFIRYYCTSLAHRLLKTKSKQRDGLMVEGFVQTCMAYSRELSATNFFDPGKVSSLKLARLIDRNRVLRSTYLFFRGIYSKPIYS